jgi:hypothetical protein
VADQLATMIQAPATDVHFARTPDAVKGSYAALQ